MSSAIKYNPNIIGLIVVMKTVESNCSSKLRWIRQSKRNNNYGDNTSPSKIKIIFKRKERLLKSSKKSIQFNIIEEL